MHVCVLHRFLGRIIYYSSYCSLFLLATAELNLQACTAYSTSILFIADINYFIWLQSAPPSRNDLKRNASQIFKRIQFEVMSKFLREDLKESLVLIQRRSFIASWATILKEHVRHWRAIRIIRHVNPWIDLYFQSKSNASTLNASKSVGDKVL